MNKRRFLLYSMLSAVTLPRLAQAGAYRPAGGAEKIQARWKEFLAEGADVALDPTPLSTPHETWRKQLPADSYAVLFEEDTEIQFTSHLNLEKRAGLYVCRACRLPLFTSEMKFDSGSGWPSFFTCIPGHLDTKRDFKIFLPRTEYHCVRCGGHQGHVFDDGPPPTRERWCNNGAALAFVPSK
jgi:peptide-methionine (R)-S-oxide reductase